MGITNYQVVYRNPYPLTNLLQRHYIEALNSQHTTRDEIFQLLRNNLRKAQPHLKRHSEKIKFILRILWVIGYFRNFNLIDKNQQMTNKHKSFQRYFGPFEVLEKIGPLLINLSSFLSKIHTIFHVPLLQKHTSELSQMTTLPISPTSDDNHPIVTPLATWTDKQPLPTCNRFTKH